MFTRPTQAPGKIAAHFGLVVHAVLLLALHDRLLNCIVWNRIRLGREHATTPELLCLDPTVTMVVLHKLCEAVGTAIRRIDALALKTLTLVFVKHVVE